MPLFILIFLVSITPVILIFDGPIAHGLVAALTGCGIASVALRIRAGEATFLLRLIRPLAIFALILAFWIILQALPLGIIGISNPVWQSAAQALGQSMHGSISIDVGATVVSLGRYLTSAAIALLATAVAIDRKRAALVLYALAAATAVIALVSISNKLIGIPIFGTSPSGSSISGASDSVALGAVLSMAVLIRLFEQSDLFQSIRRAPFGKFSVAFTACIFSISVCLILSAATQTLYPAVVGLMALMSVVLIRHFALGVWGYAAIAAVVLVVLIAIFAIHVGLAISDATLAFGNAPSSLRTITRHMLDDTGLWGTGAGTFSRLAPVYRDISDIGTNIIAPTAAATITLELGKLAFWAILVAAVVLILSLLAAALRRGRDSFYPAAGAGCLTGLVMLGFEDAGLFSSAVSIIAATIVGLAIAQRKSRTTAQ